MGHRIVLAGAYGVIGRRLTPLLHAAGHAVFGTTRSVANADALRALGAEPIVMDVFDEQGLMAAIAAVRPYAVIHQLTDLPDGLDPARMAAAVVRNARIRDLGTRNLVRAAIAAGVRRFIAQSIAWAYAAGPEPHRDQLDEAAALANVRVETSDFKLEWMEDPWDDVDRAGAWLQAIANKWQPDLVHLNGFCHGALPWPSPSRGEAARLRATGSRAAERPEQDAEGRVAWRGLDGRA